MAIPFNLPADEETEDNHGRLDQLLLDLYHVLRQILLRNRDEGEREGATAPNRSRHDDDVRLHRLDPNLADAVSSTLDLDCQCLCQNSRRRRRRRRRRTCCQDGEQSHPSQDSTTTSLAQVSRPVVRRVAPREQDWLLVGEHLRRIAEEFKTASLRKEEYPKQESQDLHLQVKTSGLFSLLVPTHFRHSLWTTVILLVGWRILVRAR